MNENDHFNALEPRKDTNSERLRFGNGLVIETVVENHFNKQDAILIHFVPDSTKERVINNPESVPKNERIGIAVDGLKALLSFAQYLRHEQVEIANHNPSKQLYLFADTNPELAIFLKQRAGFEAIKGDNHAWMNIKDFSSDENITHMLEQYKILLNLLQRSNEPRKTPTY